MMRLRVLWLVAGMVFAPGARSSEPAPSWKAGVATVDITPDGPMWLAGYGTRNRPSEGVVQHIFAKALALEEDAGSRLVLVTLDLVHVPRPLRSRVEKEVAQRYALGPASILLNASHTHSAPAPYAYGVPDPVYARKGEEYGRWLEDKVLEVIAAALAGGAPARLHYAHARAGFAMNRRLPAGKEIRNSPYADGPVDPDVPVLRVTGADGKIKAVVFGYACHNTVTGFYRINGDYAGYAQAMLQESHPGAVAMFVQGAAGDQNPYPRQKSLEQSEQHGRTLANAVEAALGAGPLRPLRGPLRSAYGLAELQYAKVTRAELEARAKSNRAVEKQEAQAVLRTLDAAGVPPVPGASVAPVIAFPPYPCPVQVVSFGPELTLIALGGEPTVEYSLRLKRELAADGRAVWVAGYSNDGFGYLGSRRVIEQGGYEGRTANFGRHPAPWVPEVEDRVVGRAVELLHSLRP